MALTHKFCVLIQVQLSLNLAVDAVERIKGMSKKYHTQKGIWAEIIASWILRMKGYRLLKRRWRTFVGEIDLLMQKGNTLVIVEVKYRPTYVQAVESINAHKKRRLLSAGHIALQHYGTPKTSLRFDAFVFYKIGRVQHLMDCWCNILHK